MARVDYIPAPVDVDGVTALTNNVSGTADDTIQDVTDQVDSAGISPAAHRDQTRSALLALKNNVNDLADKLNELRAALDT